MPLQHPLNAAVAQWIEYWPPKPRVVGSIPASRAIKIKGLNSIWLSLICLLFLYKNAMRPKSLRSAVITTSYSKRRRTFRMITGES